LYDVLEEDRQERIRSGEELAPAGKFLVGLLDTFEYATVGIQPKEEHQYSGMSGYQAIEGRSLLGDIWEHVPRLRLG
jgi:hypothetical protein